MFKGFKAIDLLERDPRTLCFILADELTKTNQALQAVSEEVKQLRETVKKIEYK
ncbi:hypothetical protein [Pectinatus frisingensis]|uniref:hypothetical protein n=1 Tax=Pectinatus frisingensis TaxID=865 RepID=UPI0018C59DDF|nr:hypothetical protein [Pectinatus frisingensis]